jgi:hypothetical protein
MDQKAVNDETLGKTSGPGDPVKDSGVLEDAQLLWRELREQGHDRFRLVALETQRAGMSLVAMLMAGVMVALLLSGAWLGFLAAAVLMLIEYGVVASNAILLAVVFNLLLALILCGVIRRKSRYLQFPATLRSLRSMPQERRNKEAS